MDNQKISDNKERYTSPSMETFILAGEQSFLNTSKKVSVSEEEADPTVPTLSKGMDEIN